MTDLPNWVTDVSAGKVDRLPHISVPGLNDRPLAPEIIRLATEFLEQFLRNVVRAVMGFFPGGDTAFNILSQWGEDLHDNIQGFITQLNQIGDIFNGLVVVPFNAAVAHVADWFQENVFRKINIETLFSGADLSITPDDFEPGLAILAAGIDGAGKTISQFLDGLRNALTIGAPTSGVTVDEVTFAASAIKTKVVDTSDSVATVRNRADKVKNRPWWESPSPFEEVSVPRVLLQPRLNPSTLVYDKPDVTLADGTLHLIPVRMRDSQVINEVGLLVLGDDPPPTALYLGLFTVDPVTGAHALIHDFGDVKGDIDTGPEMLYEQRFQTGVDILGPAGDVFSVGILPIGDSFRVAGVMRDQIITAFTLYPQSSTEVVTGQSSMPTDVDDADMDHTFGYRVYVSVGQTFTDAPEDETLLTLNETFNVPPTNSWSSPSWVRFLTASAKLYVDSSGGIRAGTTGVAGGDSTFWGAGLATTKLNTDDQSVELTIGDNTWSTGAYNHVTMRGYVRCKSDGSTGACMHIDSNGTGAGLGRVRIANTTAMSGIGTVRATVTGLTIASGDRFRLEAVGDTYTVYQNDVAIPGATWTDTGGAVVPVGKTWRYVGWGHGERTTVGSFWRMAALDEWTARDVA
ncbi:hypothetical protein FHT44_005135 [Mycolicibacterium sp. BK634]|uniref:hypothetical protein n=1 Tax=Mycolicibacterium sp. BK634 TaxID=2587099 RepID=UPI00161674BE|nr:hypothetical protein [Mycolicibacterium sp. BK634]MBB3752623.1 hypothetical protein [Mycolicibacterium sp. BK634]